MLPVPSQAQHPTVTAPSLPDVPDELSQIRAMLFPPTLDGVANWGILPPPDVEPNPELQVINSLKTRWSLRLTRRLAGEARAISAAEARSGASAALQRRADGEPDFSEPASLREARRARRRRRTRHQLLSRALGSGRRPPRVVLRSDRCVVSPRPQLVLTHSPRPSIISECVMNLAFTVSETCPTMSARYPRRQPSDKRPHTSNSRNPKRHRSGAVSTSHPPRRNSLGLDTTRTLVRG